MLSINSISFTTIKDPDKSLILRRGFSPSYIHKASAFNNLPIVVAVIIVNVAHLIANLKQFISIHIAVRIHCKKYQLLKKL